LTVTKKVTKTEPGATVTQKRSDDCEDRHARAGTRCRADIRGRGGAADRPVDVCTSPPRLARGRQRRPAAYRPLVGTHSDDFRYEAYVTYDLGKALAELGRCPQALRYLDRSEELQGTRGIEEARTASDSAD
jgi:hypothetical protein